MPTTASETKLRMSYDDYVELIAELENAHSEWVDGEVTIFMSNTTRHQELFALLYWVLSTFARLRRLGRVYSAPYEMKLRAGRSYREPDILFVATANLVRIDARRLGGPADLAVEILSDDSVARDRQEKLAEYAAAGVPEYWIVEGRDGKFGFELFVLDGAGRYVGIDRDEQGRIRSRVLPGLWIDPTWFGQSPLPEPEAVLDEIAPTWIQELAARRGTRPPTRSIDGSGPGNA